MAETLLDLESCYNIFRDVPSAWAFIHVSCW